MPDAKLAKPKPKPKVDAAPPAPDTSAARPIALHGIAIFGGVGLGPEGEIQDPVQAAVDAAVAQHNEAVAARLEKTRADTIAKARQRDGGDPVQAAMDAAVAVHSAKVAKANARQAAAIDEDRLEALRTSILEEARQEAAAAIAAALEGRSFAPKARA